MSDADDPTGLALQMAEASSCNFIRLAARGRPLQFDFILYRVRGSLRLRGIRKSVWVSDGHCRLILSNLGSAGQNGFQMALGGSF